MRRKVSMTINGTQYEHEVEPRLLLVYHIRENAGLTGTHIGCDTSNCGACTVEIDGHSVKSCTVFAVQAEGAQITTIEGLSNDSSHPVQQAWVEIGVPQCGYCQSGQIMSAVALLASNAKPTDQDIDAAMSGNVCRCGTYNQIRAAIKDAATTLSA